MTTKLRALLATGTIAAALATAANAAAARNLSVSNQRIRIVWRELRLSVGIELRWCDLTLEGSFHYRTIVKAQNLIGLITRADVNLCESPTILLNVPWHIRYRSFGGRLPNITSVRLGVIGMAFLTNFMGFTPCLFQSTEEHPFSGEAILGAGGIVTGFQVDETAQFPLFRDLGVIGFCPSEFSWVGTGAVTPAGTASRLTITLI